MTPRLMPLRNFSCKKRKLAFRRANTGVKPMSRIKRGGRTDLFWRQKTKTTSGRPFIVTTLRRIRRMLSEK